MRALIRRAVSRRALKRRALSRRAWLWQAAVIVTIVGLVGCASAASSGRSSSLAGSDDGATPVRSGPELEETDPGGPTSLDAVAQADASAGVRSSGVPEVGDGKLVTVPGTANAPVTNTRRSADVAIQIEGGLDVDANAFATFVMSTLNDPRSWAGDGYSFARTDDPATADVIVVLASPDTSADMCRPLVTGGRLSCREGRRAILTYYRWVNGQDDYGADRTGYRHYVVNHEVGHFLGNGHRNCPGQGELAPVMMQQTKGLLGCLPNPWPNPEVTTPS